MLRYKYSFAGVTFLIECEYEIQTEEKFSIFRTEDNDIDYKIQIIPVNSLPEPEGLLHSFSKRRRSFFNGSGYMMYTSFFDVYEMKDVEYACKVDDCLYILEGCSLREAAVFDALNLPSLLLNKSKGLLHCSVVKFQNEAILFAGDKQAGKSTQASLWKEFAGAEIINGDRGAVYNMYDGVFVSGIPFCGTSGICRNEQLPVRAIVCLSKGASNRIEKLNGAKAYLSLLGKFTYNSYSVEESELVYGLLSEIIEAVPVYSYECVKDESAVSFLKEYLY